MEYEDDRRTGNQTLIRLRDITKVFPENGVVANRSVSLDIYQGEIHALVGENGSGKSTLMHILSGLIPPDSGSIELSETVVKLSSPHRALSIGIGMVHQHVQRVKEFSVLENIILGQEPRTRLGSIDLKTARRQVSSLMDTYHLRLDLDRKGAQLSADGLQKTALLALLYTGVKVLILDEPTKLFEENQQDLLFSVLRRLLSLIHI